MLCFGIYIAVISWLSKCITEEKGKYLNGNSYIERYFSYNFCLSAVCFSEKKGGSIMIPMAFVFSSQSEIWVQNFKCA